MSTNYTINTKLVLTRKIQLTHHVVPQSVELLLENVPRDHKSSHDILKDDILKYANFKSARRLEIGTWHACEEKDCPNKLILTAEDIKIALTNSFVPVKEEYERRLKWNAEEKLRLENEYVENEKLFQKCVEQIENRQLTDEEHKKDLEERIEILTALLNQRKDELILLK